jgi:CCR4-NOT complex subunit CAF16
MLLLWPQVLLLDEITVDLDVLARADLLEFLKEESEQRKATIVYVSHLPACYPCMHAFV